MIRRRVIVRGSVQGVWYRHSCKREATTAGVAGWIQNNDDGSVEAVLEGEAAAVDRVVSWMRMGPEGAIVSEVEITDEPPQGEPSFRVR